MELKIKEIYFKKIGKGSNGFWKDINQRLNVISDNDILLLDFEDMILEQPWENKYFQYVFKDKRLYFRVYNNEEFKQTVELLCKMGGLKTGRVENIEVEQEKEEEKVIINAGIQIVKDKLEVLDNVPDNKSYTINVYKAVSSINYDTTFYAIKAIMEERPNKKAVINLGNISVPSESVVKLFIRLQNCTIISTNPKTKEKFRLYKSLKKIRVQEKVRILKEECEIGTAGVLYRYKETRKLDEFGRSGDGEPISSRPAILRHIFSKVKEIYCEFEIFDANNFETTADREARGEEPLGKLPVVKEIIPLNELGYEDSFMGTLYHFNMPIHDKNVELYKTYKFNGIEHKEIQVTLPKLMKIVFDEYKIEYNVTNLLKAIGKSGQYGQ